MSRFRTARYTDDSVIQSRVAAAEIFLREALRVAETPKRLRDAPDDIKDIRKALDSCSDVRLMVPVWATAGEERAITVEEFNERCLQEMDGAQGCIREILGSVDQDLDEYRQGIREGLESLYEITVLMEMEQSISGDLIASMAALRGHLRKLISLMTYRPLAEVRRKRVRQMLSRILDRIAGRNKQQSSRKSREEIREEFTKKAVSEKQKKVKEKPIRVWRPEQ